jgi:alkanesulfonate monooxygenase SsuD/methylene tetrahydromethanopterin reductase-like flavin-dependent oxidoreductase (luciferase family)
MGGNQGDDRAATNPIFGENRLKLGTFCNNSAMPQMSLARERYNPTWDRSKAIANRVNAMGMEAILSLATWRGPIWGDARHCSNQEFEPFTWAAALSALSTHASVIPTFHVKLMKPAFVAKAVATIDHITGGRAAVNIVAGNTEVAYAQFGETMEDPIARYEHVTEFTEALKKFWTEVDEFEFDGRFQRVRAGASLPKPVQKPHPPIINAGASEPGRQYIAKHADVCFTHIKPDEASWEPQFASYRKLAFDEYRRTVQVWSHGYVVVRPTEREAEDYLRWYAEEQADHPWVDGWLSKLRAGVQELRPSQALYMSKNWAAGGGFPLVGTPEKVVDILLRLSRAGLDGMLLTALEPEKMLDTWASDVMPLIEQAGLRKPFKAPAHRESSIATAVAGQPSSK